MSRAVGFDASHYNGEITAPEKFDFCYVKVSEGKLNYVENRWGYANERTQNVLRSSASVPVTMPYHYMRSNNKYWYWLDQMKTFLQAAESAERLTGFKPMGYVLDFMDPAGNDFNDEFYCMQMEAIKWLDAEVEQEVFNYMNKAGHQKLSQAQYTWMFNYPLIEAQYPFYGWNPVLLEVPDFKYPNGRYKWNPALPAGVTDWDFWQHTDKAPSAGIALPRAQGGIDTIDLNVYNGTPVELKTRFGLIEEVPEEPTGEPVRTISIRSGESLIVKAE